MADMYHDEKRVLRWGICSAGKISHDFVAALRTAGLPAYGLNEAHAVAARDLRRAREFGAAHGIEKCYGSYEDLARDPEIDVAYIGTVTSAHYELSKLMLENGKHVLCEKTMMLNSQQTEEILALATEKKLFIMEAVWTRFFPAMDKLRQLLSQGLIGDPLFVEASLGKPISHVENICRPELGGGCLLSLFVYVAQLAVLVFGGKPKSVVGKGSLLATGVEESCVAILEYEGGRYAQLAAHCGALLQNSAIICGTKGNIAIPAPIYAPTSLVLPAGRVDFPLPPADCRPCHLNYDGSSGLSYQAASVRECIIRGKLENPYMAHEDTRAVIRIMDDLRRQLGSDVL